MKKLLFLSLFFLVFFVMIPITNAAYVISPDMIEERYGFEIKFIEGEGKSYYIDGTTKTGEYYVFINNVTKCKLLDFVYKDCGKKYLTDIPCVPIGENVWPFEHCCDKAESYLKPYTAGQPRCLKISSIEKSINQIKYNPKNLWAGILIGILLLGFLVFYFVKKKRGIG